MGFPHTSLIYSPPVMASYFKSSDLHLRPKHMNWDTTGLAPTKRTTSAAVPFHLSVCRFTPIWFHTWIPISLTDLYPLLLTNFHMEIMGLHCLGVPLERSYEELNFCIILFHWLVWVSSFWLFFLVLLIFNFYILSNNIHFNSPCIGCSPPGSKWLTSFLDVLVTLNGRWK